LAGPCRKDHQVYRLHRPAERETAASTAATARHDIRRRVRPSRHALVWLAFAALAFALSLLDGLRGGSNADAAMQAQVVAWGLTDLALFTEARYTRHQADRFAPFQDHPGALEHFPSGALARPPAHWRRPAEP